MLAVCGGLLLAVGLVFGQTVRHEFVNLDDGQYVSENPHVTRDISAEGVIWALTQRHHYNWCPLTWWSYMLDYQLCGLKPWGYHLTNVLLHAATAILLFLVLRGMTGCLWPSALVTALFAVHPLRVESVAWVAERKDVLSGLFFMLTIGAYVSYARHRFSLARYLTVMVFFALGLMAKPMLVTLPFVLLLLDYWPLGRMDVKPRPTVASVGTTAGRGFMWRSLGLVVEKTPLLALAGAACGLTLWAQRELVVPTANFPYYWRIGNVLVSYVAYLHSSFARLAWRCGILCLFRNLQTWKILGCFGLLTAATVGALVGWRRYPYVLVGWLWYVGMLVPVIGLVQLSDQAMADRFTYLPQIGLCLALVWGVAHVSRSWPYRGWVCSIASALVVAGLMACAWRQTTYWHDSEALWKRTLACTAQNHLAHNNLGTVLAVGGRLDEAMSHYRKALEIWPDYAEAHYNFGNALATGGRLDEAMAHFRKALQIRPDFTEAHYNLGRALAVGGRLEGAMSHYRKALEIRPDYAEAHYNLGIALAAGGRLDEAIAPLPEGIGNLAGLHRSH